MIDPTRVHYHGHRPLTGPVRVWVETLNDGDDRRAIGRPLQHRMRHSPDGFEWGFSGSGPADLALAILWHALGREPDPLLYHQFKYEIISTLRTDRWAIDQAAVLRFAANHERRQAHARQEEPTPDA
jgi:hypothetical protein